MDATDQQMMQVLAELSVLAEASAARAGRKIRGGEHDNAPHGWNRSLADIHRIAYRRANGPVARRAALRDAERAILDQRLSPTAAHGLTPDTIEWRVAIGRAEGSIEEVARKFGVSRSTVYRCREIFA